VLGLLGGGKQIAQRRLRETREQILPLFRRMDTLRDLEIRREELAQLSQPARSRRGSARQRGVDPLVGAADRRSE